MSMKPLALFCLTLSLLLAALPVTALADGDAPPPPAAEAETQTPPPALQPVAPSAGDKGEDSPPAQGSSPVLVKYTVSRSTIHKGNTATIQVSVKHPDLTLRQIGGRDNLDITRLVDSFSGGEVAVAVTSGEDDLLTYDITFSNLTYSGYGKTLRFLSGYKDSRQPFSTMELSVAEAVEYDPSRGSSPETKEPSPLPLVLVSWNEMKEPIQAGQEREVTVQFHNLDHKKIVGAVASFTPSDSLLITGGSSSFQVGDISGKKSKSLTLRVRAMEGISSSIQSLGVELKFRYDNDLTDTQGSVSDRILLPAAATEGSVPNLIVSDYRYGEGPVSAGGGFPLSFTLLNTGRVPVENILVTIDGGDSFTIDGSSNTFYYQRIAASGKEALPVKMQALASARTGAQTIGITCKYEYVDGSKRSTTSADIKLSVPVVQPDRFQINAPSLPETISAGEEISLSLAYANKGKGEVSNVEAILDGPVDSPAKSQYLGNFESGKSGSIGFVFTPQDPGETQVTLRITYEDANQEIHTRSFPLTLQVQEAVMESFDDLEIPPEEPGGLGPWLWVGGGALLVALGLGWLRLRRKRKAAQAVAALPAGEESWDDWEEPAGAPEAPSREPDGEGEGL